jgi:hypothetical protein
MFSELIVSGLVQVLVSLEKKKPVVVVVVVAVARWLQQPMSASVVVAAFGVELSQRPQYHPRFFPGR